MAHTAALAHALAFVQSSAPGGNVELLRRESLGGLSAEATARLLSRAYSAFLPVTPMPGPPLPLQGVRKPSSKHPREHLPPRTAFTQLLLRPHNITANCRQCLHSRKEKLLTKVLVACCCCFGAGKPRQLWPDGGERHAVDAACARQGLRPKRVQYLQQQSPPPAQQAPDPPPPPPPFPLWCRLESVGCPGSCSSAARGSGASHRNWSARPTS